MIMLSIFRIALSAAPLVTWMLSLATRLLARALNMPEPLLQHAGALASAHLRAIENSVGQMRCLLSPLRQFLNPRR